MTATSLTVLEERLKALEEQVASLAKRSSSEAHAAPAPWWQRHFGAFKDSPYYEEAMRLGAEYRGSQPTSDESELDVSA